MLEVCERPDDKIEKTIKEILSGRSHVRSFFGLYDPKTAIELGNILIAFQDGLVSKEDVVSCVSSFLRFHSSETGGSSTITRMQGGL